MKYLLIIFISLFIQTESFGALTQKSAANPFKILVFWKTAGYTHAAIGEQITYFQTWGTKYGFDVENSNNSDIWTKDYLNQYAAIVLLSTTGDFLNDSQKALFKNYVESGHGVVGIHAALDAFADDNRVSTWPWYTNMIGSVFGTHPIGSNHDGAGDMVISTHSFPGFSAIPDRWTWGIEEWYYVKTDVRLTGCVILAALDENSIDNVGVPPLGFTHPAIWYHDYNGGRFFYTVRGHGFNKLTDEVYNEYAIVGGIYYAAGFPAPTFPDRPPLAYASSSSFAGGYASQTNEPENATDGRKDTQWEPTQYTKPEWIYFDYYSERKFTGATLDWTDAAPTYKIQSSNDSTNWSDVYTAGGSGKINFTATARYLRVYVTSGCFLGGFMYAARLIDFIAEYTGGTAPTGLGAIRTSRTNVNTIFKNQMSYDLMGRRVNFGLSKSETQNGQRKFKVQ